jgi:hypothetical protein
MKSPAKLLSISTTRLEKDVRVAREKYMVFVLWDEHWDSVFDSPSLQARVLARASELSATLSHWENQ